MNIPKPFEMTIGNATFSVTRNGNEMLYTVNAININHVIDVVLICSKSGLTSNVAFLRSESQQGATGPINGLLVQGNITSSNLVGLLKRKHIQIWSMICSMGIYTCVSLPSNSQRL